MGKNYEIYPVETKTEKDNEILEERLKDENREKPLTNNSPDVFYPVPDLNIGKKLNINNLEEKDKAMETKEWKNFEKGGEKMMEKEQTNETGDPLGVKNPRYLDRSPIFLDGAEKEVVEKIAKEGAENLEKNYQPGFGIFPSASPEENFYEQVWTRDAAQAALNFYTLQEPEAIQDSLDTVFRHQRKDGALPLRTERQYMMVKVIPGLGFLAKPLFKVIENKIRGREERPIYEGQDFSNAEDTIPLALMASGEFSLASPDGKQFAKENYEKFKKAIEFFRTKVDKEDGLASFKVGNADWEDSIIRGGKLGGINIFWARALRLMSSVATRLGKKEEATAYREEFHKVKKSVLEKFYNKDGAYFRAEEGVDRVDTTASISGAMYLLDPEECARVQKTFKERVKTPAGLKNFDPPYPSNQIIFPQKIINNQSYHNADVWPWVTCQNIQVKIKIALGHPDESVRKQYKKEAVEDLTDMAKLFHDAGGAYEIFHSETRRPAIKKSFFSLLTSYKPPRNLMGNLAAYQSAYTKMKEFGWI